MACYTQTFIIMSCNWAIIAKKKSLDKNAKIFLIENLPPFQHPLDCCVRLNLALPSYCSLILDMQVPKSFHTVFQRLVPATSPRSSTQEHLLFATFSPMYSYLCRLVNLSRYIYKTKLFDKYFYGFNNFITLYLYFSAGYITPLEHTLNC